MKKIVVLLLFIALSVCGPKKRHHHHHHRPNIPLEEAAKADDAKCGTEKEKKLETAGLRNLVLIVEGDCPVKVSGAGDDQEYEPGSTVVRAFKVPEGGTTLKFTCKEGEKDDKCKFTAWTGVAGQVQTYADEIEDAKCEGGKISIIVDGQASLEVKVKENACPVEVEGSDGGEKKVDSDNPFKDKISPANGQVKTATITCEEDPAKPCKFAYTLEKK